MNLSLAFFENCDGKPVSDLCPIESLIFDELRRDGEAMSIIGQDGIERVARAGRAAA